MATAHGARTEHRVKKQVLVAVLKYGLGFVLLAVVCWRNWAPASGPGLRDTLAGPMQPWPLFAAASILVIGVLINLYRWYILVRAQELPFTLSNAVRLGLVGLFFSNFLPGSIGGDIVKAAAIAREQSRRTVSVATVIIDRAMGLWAIAWLVAFFGIWNWGQQNPTMLHSRVMQVLVLGMVGAVAGSLAACFILMVLPGWRATRLAARLERIPRIGHSAAEFWRAIWMYRQKIPSVTAALVLSVCSQLCFVTALYFAGQIFRSPGQPLAIPSFGEHFLVVPVGMAIQALGVTPGGMGIGEAGFGFLYAQVDPSMEQSGVLASFAQRVIMWGLGLVGYLVYLRMRPTFRPALTDEAETAKKPPLMELQPEAI
jgi:uncharacterized protein (TIRG00374 family)